MKYYKRFSFLIYCLFVTGAFGLFAQSLPEHHVYVYIGGHESGPGRGISLATFDTITGVLSKPELVIESEAPSYLQIAANKNYLYACNSLEKFQGKDEGALSAFKIDRASGHLSLVNQQPSGGVNPCHVSIDGTGHFLFAANYNSGSVIVRRILPDGSIGEETGFDQHSGKGINPERQEGPHAHCIKADPSNRFVLATDLGTDKLMVYRFDDVSGSITPNDPAFAKVSPGLGPRHFTFSPNGNFCYLVDEMGNAVTVFAWDVTKGKLKELQTIGALPADFQGFDKSAEIRVHPSGKFLYCSNRGHNSLTVFSINNATGLLAVVQHVPAMGQSPRNFDFDPSGKWLIVTNHDGNNAVVFSVDQNTGQLKQHGDPVQVHNPFCLQFFDPE